MVLLPNLCVKQRPCLCDVRQYVSAQALVFLDLGQNPSFPILKLASFHPAFPEGHQLNKKSIAQRGAAVNVAL
jgi:hypothetical protein